MNDPLRIPRIVSEQAAARSTLSGVNIPAKTMAEHLLENKVDMTTAEKVTCIMVHYDSPRLAMTRTAVNNLLRDQSYRNLELVIVNSTGRRITNREHPSFREYEVSPQDYSSVGSLKNFGIQQARGAWIAFTADDAHSHPHRLTLQMAHRVPGKCSLFSHVCKVDVRNSVVCIDQNPKGQASTILFPREHAGDFDPNLSIDEDQDFLDRMFDEDQRILVTNDSSWFPGPCALVEFWHGRNAKTREEFLKEYAEEKYLGVRNPGVTTDVLEYVQVALQKHKADMSLNAGKETAAPNN